MRNLNEICNEMMQVDFEPRSCQPHSPSIPRLLTTWPRCRIIITNMDLETHILFTYVRIVGLFNCTKF